jgi:hypothetical protein
MLSAQLGEPVRKLASFYSPRNSSHGSVLWIFFALLRANLRNALGSANGRGLQYFASALPGALVCGVEPVVALVREDAAAGHSRVVPLFQASGDALPFANANFDAVSEFTMLYHVPDISEGDGLFYSYSIYDSYDLLMSWADRILTFPSGHTHSRGWFHPLLTSSGVIVIAPRNSRERQGYLIPASLKTALRVACNVNSNVSFGIFVMKGSMSHPSPVGISRVSVTTRFWT